MKRAHRRAHLWMWIVIAPLAAYGLLQALSARKDRPIETWAPAAPDAGAR